MALAELKETVAVAHNVLYTFGLADYLGHASARIPGTDRIIIKPRFSPRIGAFSELSAAHMVVVDLEGKLVEGQEPPPAEVFIHTEVYRARPEVGGVVHTHQLWATCFGATCRQILPILHNEAQLIRQGQGFFPSGELIVTSQQGAAVAQALGERSACHLRYHGIVTAAPTIEEATIYAIWLERSAKANYIALQLGELMPMPEAQMDQVARHKAPMEGRWVYYKSLAAQAKGALYPV